MSLEDENEAVKWWWYKIMIVFFVMKNQGEGEVVQAPIYADGYEMI